MVKAFITNLFSVKKSIQAKIFIASVIVNLASMIGFATIVYLNAADTIKSNSTVNISNSIKNANNNLEVVFKEMNDITAAILLNDDIVKDVFFSSSIAPSYEWFQEMKKVEGFLSSLLANKYNIARIIIATDDNRIYKAGRRWVDNSIMDGVLAKKIVDAKGKLVLVKNDMSKIGQDDVITMGRAVLNNNGEVLGIICIDADYSIIERIYNIEAVVGSMIFVLDNHGNIIYNSETAEENQVLDYNVIQDILNGENQREVIVKDNKYLCVKYHSAYSEWTTIGMMSESVLLKQSLKFREQISFILIFVFMSSFIVSIIISSKTTKNLKHLCSIMKNINEDNLYANLTVSSEDEIGQLENRFLIMMSKIRSLMSDIKAREAQKRISELRVLQAQISPHFLYNTLNSIEYLAKLQNVPNIQEVTTSLISLLRVVSKGTEELITIRDELCYVESFVNIQKYKNINAFSVLYEVEEEVLNCKILKLLLQPIVENAIIHGIEAVNYDGIISIKIYEDQNKIKIIVTDNGIGMTREQINASFKGEENLQQNRFSSIGIGNVNERIKLYFGDEYGIKIISEPSMFTNVEISIPKIEEDELQDVKNINS